MGKRKAKIGFQFAGDYDGGKTGTPGNRTRCDLCEGRFKRAQVDVILNEFSICPRCIEAGPSVVAARASEMANDRARIERMWGGPTATREDISCMTNAYRRLAAALRSIRSFDEVRGGKLAVALPGLQQKTPPRRRGKAA